MPQVSLILPYSKTLFFNTAADIKTVISNYKPISKPFNALDDAELRRGYSYTVFSELKEKQKKLMDQLEEYHIRLVKLQSEQKSLEEKEQQILKRQEKVYKFTRKSSLKQIKAQIQSLKKKIRRASFDLRELQEDPNQGISVADFRNSLISRGVVDREFQNKILHFFIQRKAGLHFALAKGFCNLLSELPSNRLFAVKSEQLDFEVQNSQHVKLIFQADYVNPDSVENLCLHAKMEIDFFPSKVLLSKVDISSDSSSQEVEEIFAALQENSISLLEKLIIFIKKLFNKMDNGIELENSNIKFASNSL